MSEPRLESPLIDRPYSQEGSAGPAEYGVCLGERPFLGHFSLRGQAGDEAFVAACAHVLGVALPQTPNTYVEGEGVVVGWMGPTEWLVLVAADVRQEWLAALRDAMTGIHAGVVDLSGGQTLIRLTGDNAGDVLGKGSTLDWHPRVADVGFCTRSLLAKSAVFVRVVEADQHIEIIVRRSFADYLWQWLIDAAEEYGCRILPAESTLAFAGLARVERPEAVNAS